MELRTTRRDVIRQAAGTGAAVAASIAGFKSAAAASPPELKGNINHSVCRWCYGKIPLEDLCQAANVDRASSRSNCWGPRNGRR